MNTKLSNEEYVKLESCLIELVDNLADGIFEEISSHLGECEECHGKKFGLREASCTSPGVVEIEIVEQKDGMDPNLTDEEDCQIVKSFLKNVFSKKYNYQDRDFFENIAVEIADQRDDDEQVTADDIDDYLLNSDFIVGINCGFCGNRSETVS